MTMITKEAFHRKRPSGSTISIFLMGALFGSIFTMICFSQSSSSMTVSMIDSSSCATIQKSTTTATAAVASNIKKDPNDGDNGWHQIDVFYGDREGMLVKSSSSTSSQEKKQKQKWYSQVGQDKMVYKYLGNLENGYFVDLASNDATVISNSYALETFHGWNGLCIEPNTKYWARLAFRKCNVIGAVVSRERMEAIDFNFGKKGSEGVKFGYTEKLENAMGGGIVATGMDNEHIMTNKNKFILAKRYAVTLGEIFARNDVPKTIDYLSLDVEGAEYFVLSVFPLDEYKIRILSIERPTKELKEFLESKDYVFIEDIGTFGETIWAHSSEVANINKIREAMAAVATP